MRIRKADTKTITVAQAKAQIQSLLAGARTLDHFTPEMLARTHKVPVRDCEYLLVLARQKRNATSENSPGLDGPHPEESEARP